MKRMGKVAYHEAGHAILAIYHFYESVWATIDPALIPIPGADGYCGYKILGIQDPKKCPFNARMGISISWAGTCAESIYTKQARFIAHQHARTDMDTIDEIAEIHGICPYEVDELAKRTRKILRSNWKMVEAIARVLLDKGTWRGDDPSP